MSGTTHTNAGTYTTTPGPSPATANYNNTNGTIADVIGKADATVMVTPYSVTYDGNPHTATCSITGVDGETGATVGTRRRSDTKNINAGTSTADACTFTGDANYNDSNGRSMTIIGKANATVMVTPYSVTYDGNPHTATSHRSLASTARPGPRSAPST